ncbi:MAG TPA: hypothetical protein VMR18_02405 [Candidatus Saccharimonadales bacterium]|jgi:hypothetical protein|nr:hypothetical protein [Candidatus Saccharimonadales bacterium]
MSPEENSHQESDDEPLMERSSVPGENPDHHLAVLRNVEAMVASGISREAAEQLASMIDQYLEKPNPHKATPGSEDGD